MARVLLCARGGACDLPAISHALRDRGVEPLELDSSAFPSGAPVSLGFDAAGFRGAAPDDLAGVTAVWHQLVVGTDLPAMEAGMRETCVAAAERVLIGLFDSLGVFQLDPAWAKARADNKPYQLRLAQQAGLAIPRTIVSNDADAVRAFARAVGGPVITKMVVQPTTSGDGDEHDAGFTTALRADELAHLDGLDLCPMIFQEQIAHRRDVRVTVVGRRVFGAARERTEGGGDEIDGRHYALDRAPAWRPYAVPDAIAARVLAVLDGLALNYGAADFAVEPDGRHVFLELDASGSFAVLGEALQAPIAAAIADVLVDPAARRVVDRP
ncbi:MAG TPA: hypothetical protein VFP84_37695 [Kofleriaceae bacterium]|nr:hypothetical protein [Kofleriaceae bacterium]